MSEFAPTPVDGAHQCESCGGTGLVNGYEDECEECDGLGEWFE